LAKMINFANGLPPNAADFPIFFSLARKG
jgi:hypothetical protein